MGLPILLPVGVLLRSTVWGEPGGLFLLGAIPGTAESGATNEMGAAAAGKHVYLDQQPGALLRELHQRAEEAGGFSQRAADAPEHGGHEHARYGGGIQEQVRLQAGPRAWGEARQGTDSQGKTFCSSVNV